jgi:hypothetical protein
MNQYGGNDAKIKGVQPQSSPWKGEIVGKKNPTWNFGINYLLVRKVSSNCDPTFRANHPRKNIMPAVETIVLPYNRMLPLC